MAKLTRYVKDQIKYGVKDKDQIFIIYIYIYIYIYLVTYLIKKYV